MVLNSHLKELSVLTPHILVTWLLATAIVPTATAPMSPELPQVSDEQRSPVPVVNTYYNYYSVSGNTVLALQSQMQQFGPFNELEERHYAAYTSWYVEWSYDYAMTDRGCKITSTEGKVDITFTLPRWDIPPNTPQSLVSAWNQFLTAVQIHENGHVDHGISAGTEILHLLNHLPAYPSCQDLKTAAGAATQQIIQYYNQQDLAYDRETQHGLTQGAIFPPQPTAAQESHLQH